MVVCFHGLVFVSFGMLRFLGAEHLLCLYRVEIIFSILLIECTLVLLDYQFRWRWDLELFRKVILV